MKICTIILYVIIIFTSCSGISSQKEQSKDVDENWQIKMITTQKHTYNLSGLIVATYRTGNLYHNGEPGEILDYLISRKYDTSNNLINEKEFHIFNNKSELYEEKLFEYDTRNNLLLETDKSEKVINKIVKRTYNNLNQKTEETEIRKQIDQRPKNWNLDSEMAHFGDKKISRYDTSFMSFEYDIKGNLVKEVYKNSHQENQAISTTLFSDKEKILSFVTNPKNDTVTITNYEKQGNLIAEITHEKDDPLSVTTTLYDGDKKIQQISINKKMNWRSKETYKYDRKGNEIENISYK